MRFFILLLFIPVLAFSQQTDSIAPAKLKFFQPAPKFNKVRFGCLTAGIASAYTGVVIGLDRVWYASYPRSGLHFFNDWHEWRGMDKAGHLMTTYFESKWVGNMYKWAGVPAKKARWIGFGAGMLFQATLETLDGTSAEWGFSWGDIGFNTIGATLYVGQELLWNEQRLHIKLSVHKPHYSDAPLASVYNPNVTTSLRDRANHLYGSAFHEMFFKEYNGQTIWASLNIASFCRKKPKWLPEWLNVAVGYGVENLYGARRNTWYDEEGNRFKAPDGYKRCSQFYLSFDVDFERIPVRQRGWKVLFGILNVFKVPFPTLEVNTLGKVRFHPMYF